MIHTQCAFCGYKHDRITIMVDIGDAPCPPEPGDATMCISCGQMNIFSDDMSLRAPTPKELIELDEDSRVQHMRKAWREAKGLQ